MLRMKLLPIGACALMLAACGTSRPASVAGGECKVFVRPASVIVGATARDQDWIDDTIERGVAGCGWKRPSGKRGASDGG